MTHIRNYIRTILLVGTVLGSSSFLLPAQSYPDLVQPNPGSKPSYESLDISQVQAFLTQWQGEETDQAISLGAFSKALAANLSVRNATLQQLRSVYQIQSRQLANLKDQAKPVFALFSDASNPLYSYSLVTVNTTGGITTTTESHKLGIGASMTQQLPSAGSVSLTVKEGSTLSLNDLETDWRWTHKPSVGFTFQQPLGLGEGLIDTSYASKILERKTLEQTGAMDAIASTQSALVLQGSSLFVLRQNLMESRYLLQRQQKLVEEELSDTDSDYIAGRVSKNDLERKTYAREQLLLQISSLSDQIDSVEDSLGTLYGPLFSSVPYRVSVSLENVERLFSYRGTALLDDSALFEKVLKNDATYKEALRKKRIAQIDSMFNNLADSPMFSLGMQLSPYYDTSQGNGFFGSIGELFSNGKPVVSVSVNFSASDLAMRTTSMTKEIAGESLSQAIIQVTEAMQGVTSNLEDFQRRLNQQILSLRLALSDYQIKANDVEVERIRTTMGLGSASSIEIRENLTYASAFTVLQSLRELELLSLELDNLLGMQDL
ncbi:hypothetical protein SpiGrapes_0808 [Sphaerochaeta pleomorpha str. Grapes]|uniref:Outer membrane protein n=1 Tax=Sphaerochaeta pleomorpha (strain ATCC BAA-1885 / DSM 22778 / Grapes) TaxID=158190 RepID=G8QQ59_SPHPG|nr:hypothetical protein [Sphaerochaeta pleomorpha]AEV28636.1 hypothetical protein SpiGrapes_0808 [Sphaerochaeta pleomorpha str. Grapes]